MFTTARKKKQAILVLRIFVFLKHLQSGYAIYHNSYSFDIQQFILVSRGWVCCFKLLGFVFVGIFPNTNWMADKHIFVWQFNLDKCPLLPNSTLWGLGDKSNLNARLVAELLHADNRGDPYSWGLKSQREKCACALLLHNPNRTGYLMRAITVDMRWTWTWRGMCYWLLKLEEYSGLAFSHSTLAFAEWICCRFNTVTLK